MIEFLFVLLLVGVAFGLCYCDPEHEACQPEKPEDHQMYFNWEDSNA